MYNIPNQTTDSEVNKLCQVEYDQSGFKSKQFEPVCFG